jgi:hypothetical protein
MLSVEAGDERPAITAESSTAREPWSRERSPPVFGFDPDWLECHHIPLAKGVRALRRPTPPRAALFDRRSHEKPPRLERLEARQAFAVQP